MVNSPYINTFILSKIIFNHEIKVERHFVADLGGRVDIKLGGCYAIKGGILEGVHGSSGGRVV